jgi:hypothetical protein
MWKQLRDVGLVLGTVALMAAGGFAMFSLALTIVMRLGTKNHGIYDYYGYTYPFLFVAFMLGTMALGFVAPGVIVWRLHKNSWRFSIRALFIIVTVVAVLVAIYAYASSL